MPATLLVHEEDPADAIWEAAGDLSDIEVFNNKVLVGIYQRPEEAKTIGGIILTDITTREDKYQSKTGMILKTGPISFQDVTHDPPKWFRNQDMYEGDWVSFRPSDGMSLTLVSRGKDGKKQELLCRLLDDTCVAMRSTTADRIY
jgi:co-chaperonin GroES (HSP10)